ncbi:exosome component 10-like [Asterias rubens]|uniref:exosome component 10-like n=1 Tax=Asterias rubens TaxID=7604 RepID=UPI001455CEFB|nr:exosome component 10-like [Asterias rubens]
MAATSSSEMIADNPSSENCELLPGFKDVSEYSQQALGTLMQATRAAHGLPACGDDYDFYSSYKTFREYCHTQSERLLSNINSVMSQQGSNACLTSGSSAPELEDKTDAIIETNDLILEQVGLLLDEASGLIKPGKAGLPPGSQPKNAPPKLMVASWNRQNQSDSGKGRSFHMMHAKNIPRPQLKFKDKIDNANMPFVPKLSHKPNALKPLNQGISSVTKTSSSGDKDVPDAVSNFIHQQRVGNQNSQDISAHPYQYELDHLKPDPSMLVRVDSPSFASLDEVPVSLVDTVQQLNELSQLLDKQKEFAVDLEHHSYRSFQGFTCLMQISTSQHDFIIDTLALRSELHILNNSFTNPAIVKVFHGADMDIEWLQRDLGIYVVNMVDTGQASRILGKARNSLAHLLQLYCEVNADKKYQLADWRIRPLPEEMLKYSREDTHYLLYIYHKMKNELIERGNKTNNLLLQAIERSRQVCLRRYHKPIFTDESYLALWRKNKKTFNAKQYEALKLLYKWRDRTARQEDESTGYILPNHMLLQIAENLPREAHGILACCNPIPPLVRQQLNEVHQLILKAKAYQGKIKIPSSTPKTASPPSQKGMFPLKPIPAVSNSLLYCPHDPTPQPNSQTDDQGHSQPTHVAHHSSLFGSRACSIECRTAQPIITAFDVNGTGKEVKMTPGQLKVAVLKSLLVNPFEKYLAPKDPVQIKTDVLEADKISLSSALSKQSSTATQISTLENHLQGSPTMWKLKKMTPAIPAVRQTPASKSQVTNESRTNEDDTKTTEAQAVPLRKQKRKSPPSDSAVMTYRPPAKREKVAQETTRKPYMDSKAAVFKPFDYSKVNTTESNEPSGRGRGKSYQRGGRDGQGRGRGARGGGGWGVSKQFDPYSHTSTRGRPDFKSKNRPNMAHPKGERSMTYSKQDSGRHSGGRHPGGRHHWPKR